MKRRINPRKPAALCRAGFTLLELMVAMSVTMIIALAVYYMYTSLMDNYRRTKKELDALAAFRTSTDRMELELSCIQYGAKYLPPKYVNADTPPGEIVFKPINDGWLALRWPHGYGESPASANHLLNHKAVTTASGTTSYTDGKCRYIGFYSAVTPGRIDRVEYYFNPGEPMLYWADGLDNDGDDPHSDGTYPDPDSGPGLYVDDRGSLVQRKILDGQIEPGHETDDPPAYLLSYGRYILDLTGKWDDDEAMPAGYEYRAPRLTGDLGSEKDHGEILADGFTDVTFQFVYTKLATADKPTDGLEKRLYYADWWPYGDYNAASPNLASDLTGQRWPRDTNGGKTPKGLSYLCLPLAVHINFEFESKNDRRYLNKSIYLIQSKWNDFLTRKNP